MTRRQVATSVAAVAVFVVIIGVPLWRALT